MGDQLVARGRAAGRAEMLLRQFRRRFGELRGDVVQQVHAASIDQLDDWSERILDAKTLNDVLGADWRH